VHLAGAREKAAAGRHALLAAERATQRAAFAHAAEMYDLALRVGVGDAQLLRERHAEAFALAWKPLSAAAAYMHAAASAAPARARELRMRAVEQWLIGGDLARGLGELEQLLRDAGTSTPKRGWSAVATMLLRRAQLRLRPYLRRRDRLTVADIDLLWSASLALAMIDAPLALGYHTRALLALAEIDDPVRLSRSLSIEGCVQAGSADFAKAERLIAETSRIAREHSLGDLYVRPARIVLAVQRGAWQAVLATANHDDRRQYTAWHNASRELYQAHCEWNLGRFAELELRCDRLLREARDRGDRFLELATSVSFAPLVGLVRDDPKRARAILQRGVQLLWRGGRGGYFHALAACAARFIHLYESDTERPLTEWIGPGSESLARRSHYGRVYLEFLGATEALAKHRTDPRRTLRARIERAIRRLARDVVPWAAPYGALLAFQLDRENRDARASAWSGFARFEIGHMLDILELAPDRLRARGVVRPDRFSRMLAPAL
jgi:eukaryotic-like serine/threonine-protein kinase